MTDLISYQSSFFTVKSTVDLY